MKKCTFHLLAALFILSFTGIAHAQRAAGTQWVKASYTDPDIFIYLGLNKNTMHLVWDEIKSTKVKSYVVERSTDGINFSPIASIEPVNLYDLHANNYPDHINRYNNILYSTETGFGRFIYNDKLSKQQMMKPIYWYRVKIVTAMGYNIYTSRMQKATATDNHNNKGSTPSKLEVDSSLPAQFQDHSTESILQNGMKSNSGFVPTRLVACPDEQTPPTDYVYTGNFRTYYGTCCYWEEREYRQAIITAPCGDVNAWCCPIDCSPVAYDPCCVHTCGEYNDCSCTPWTCCDVSNSTIWIVYSSTSYNLNARITNIDNPTCNDFFDGSITVETDGVPVILYNWDNGIRTGGILYNLEAAIYSLTVTDYTGCSEVLSFTLTEPAPLTSSFVKRDVTCFGFADGSIDLTVSGGSPPYGYNWTESHNPFATTEDLSNIGPGNYAVTVTDQNGCVSNQFTPVLSPDEFTGVITMLDLGCPIAGTAVLELCCYGSNSGTALLELSGGTPPNSFIWSTGETSNILDSLAAGTYSVTAFDGNGCSFVNTFTLGQPDEIMLSATTVDATCGQCNGSATINVTGGSGGFSYLWPPTAGNQTTPTANNLCPGSYTVLVTDNFAVSCFKTITVSVSSIGGESIITSQTNASCFGACDGTASVSFNCTNPPCTVEWFDPQGTSIAQGTNSVSGLCAGGYSVVVTNASGCVSAQTVDILQPQQILDNLSLVSETCPGSCDGIASTAPTGGIAPYSFQWLDGSGTPIAGQTGSLLTDLCSGDYTLVITDATGCSATFPFSIGTFNTLTASTVETHNQCFGECNGSILATPSGGAAPYSYQWFTNGSPISGATSFSLTGLCAGTYTLQVTDDNGCTFTTPDITITETAELTASVSVTDLLCTSLCNGSATVTASGGTGSFSYKWYNGFAVEIPGETGTSIANLCAGNYFVEVTDSNGCSTGLLPLTITDINPLTAALTATNVSCNGAGDGAIDLEVSGGFSPYSYLWSNGETTQDLSNITAGTFTVEITDSSGCSIIGSGVVSEPDVVSSTISVRTYGSGGYHVSCYGFSNGELTVVASGGTPPYTYLWSDTAGQIGSTAIGLPLGSYTVTITDSRGCTATNSETLFLQPGPFTSDVTAFVYPSGFNVSCFGASDGSIDLTVNGGEPPFVFNWTYNNINDAYLIEDPTNVAAGIYYANVVDTILGCITRDTILLIQPSEIIPVLTPSVYPGGVNISTAGGNDGSIDLEVSGGFPPYSYSWSNLETTQDLSGLTAGTYEVTVTDSINCQVTASITLREPQPSVETIDTTICEGNSIFAGGAFQTTSGTYIDSFTNYFGLDSIIITNLTVLPASRTNIPVTICSGQSYFAGGAFQTQSGTYYDTLTAANGCDSIVATILDVTPPQTSTNDVTICAGQSYFAGGAFQTISGTYYDTLSAADGCDSLVIITNLTVLPPLQTVVDVQICDGTGYFAGGAFQTTSGTYYDTFTTALGCDSVIVTNLTVSPAMALSFSLTDVSCNGLCDGAVICDVAGGEAPLSFLWSDGQATQQASNLCAGTYAVTVTDANGCSASHASIIVNEPQELTAVTSARNLRCICDNLVTGLGCCDGRASVSAAGGTAPYSFEWSNGAATDALNNLCAGSYDVTVTDANGCQVSSSATVSRFEEIKVTIAYQDLSPGCSGTGLAELNFNNLPAGTILNHQYAQYGIHISGDAYGVFPDEVILYDADQVPSGPDPDLETASGKLAIFPERITDNNGNGLVDVPNDQGQGGKMIFTFDQDMTVVSFVFVDKDNNNPASAKAYDANNVLIKTINIPNRGNGSVQTVIVNASGVRKLVLDYRDSGGLASIRFAPQFSCCDGSASASVTGGNPPYSYLWSNGETTASISNLCPGVYTVTVTDADGCSASQTTRISDCSLSITDMTIVHDHFGGEVAPLTDGMTISLDTLCPFNIRANLCQSPVGSVRFKINGVTFRTEEFEPYALAGDNPGGDYHSWVPEPGDYTVQATPYSGPHASGTPGSTFTIHFTITGTPCAARLSSSKELNTSEFEVEAHPVPFNDKLIVDLYSPKTSKGTLRVMDMLSREVIVRHATVESGKNTITLETGNLLPRAVYFLEVRLDNQRKLVKLVKSE